MLVSQSRGRFGCLTFICICLQSRGRVNHFLYLLSKIPGKREKGMTLDWSRREIVSATKKPGKTWTFDFNDAFQEAKHLRYQKSRENVKIESQWTKLRREITSLPFFTGKRKLCIKKRSASRVAMNRSCRYTLEVAWPLTITTISTEGKLENRGVND